MARNVVLCCSNRASICSLALFLLSQTRWIVMPLYEYKHQSPALVQTRLDCGPSFVYKHQSPALCFKTRLICGSLSVYTHPSTALCFQTRLIMVACLFTSISLEPKWLRNGSDGDPTPRGVGFRLSPDFHDILRLNLVGSGITEDWMRILTKRGNSVITTAEGEN